MVPFIEVLHESTCLRGHLSASLRHNTDRQIVQFNSIQFNSTRCDRFSWLPPFFPFRACFETKDLDDSNADDHDDNVINNNENEKNNNDDKNNSNDNKDA